MIDHDTLQRFIFENTELRGQLVHLGASYQAVIERRNYPLPVKKLLGEIMAAAVLLSSTIKFTGSLTIRLHGDGPVNLVMVQCNHQFHVRGLALLNRKISKGDLSNMVGKGHLIITIENEIEKKNYQGIVELKGSSLSECLEEYFAKSEQLLTRIWLYASKESAGGLLIQNMPSTHPIQKNYWEHISHLANTITQKELLELPNNVLLRRLFHEEQVRIFDADPICFRCSCSRIRMENALRTMKYEELQDLLGEQSPIVVNCDFCNQKYRFDEIDIAQLFKEGPIVGASHTQH